MSDTTSLRFKAAQEQNRQSVIDKLAQAKAEERAKKAAANRRQNPQPGDAAFIREANKRFGPRRMDYVVGGFIGLVLGVGAGLVIGA